MANGHRRIFAGTELAARIERAERSLIAESALAAGRRDPGGRCFATTLAGGVAAWAGSAVPTPNMPRRAMSIRTPSVPVMRWDVPVAPTALASRPAD